jgi:nucleoid-associated protein YgaU
MGLISFLKDAGRKLFERPQATSKDAKAVTTNQPTSAAPDKVADNAAADAILAHIRQQKLNATGLTVTYDSATLTATVYGVAPDQTTREKIILLTGNVQGVEKVNDQMTVDQSGPEAKFYTVSKGDTLSKIAKQFYGDANQYIKIFEANKPMLKDPDAIYPGQMLRIPVA